MVNFMILKYIIVVNISQETKLTKQKIKKLSGTLRIIGDKSISHRALILASISGGLVEGAELHRVAWPSYLEQLIDCGLKVRVQP